MVAKNVLRERNPLKSAKKSKTTGPGPVGYLSCFHFGEICILVPGKGNYYLKVPTHSKIIIKSLGPFLQLFAYVQ